MRASVRQYYRLLVVFTMVLAIAAVAAMIGIGVIRQSGAETAVSLARLEGRVSDVMRAVSAYQADGSSGNGGALARSIDDLKAATVGLVGRSTITDDQDARLLAGAQAISAAAAEVEVATSPTQRTTALAAISAGARDLIDVAIGIRSQLEDRLTALQIAFVVVASLAGLSILAMLYLIAIMYASIRASLDWNEAVTEALESGDRLASAKPRRIRLLPGAELLALQTASVGQQLEMLAAEQREMAESNARLSRQLMANVEELNASRDDFARSAQYAAIGKIAGSVSHEINNPVTGILGYLAYLRKRVEDPELSMYIGKAQSEVERIGRVAKALLVFSRHSPGDEPKAFDLVPAAENVLMLVQPQLTDVGIDATLAVDGEPRPVVGLIDKFQQVLLNLLLNARDALRDSDVRRIAIHIDFTAEPTRLTVADTGPGIPTDLQDRIFEPFFTTKPAGSGSGLGLAVTRELMLRMGGTIDLASDPGTGARFVLTIPTARVA